MKIIKIGIFIVSVNIVASPHQRRPQGYVAQMDIPGAVRQFNLHDYMDIEQQLPPYLCRMTLHKILSSDRKNDLVTAINQWYKDATESFLANAPAEYHVSFEPLTHEEEERKIMLEREGRIRSSFMPPAVVRVYTAPRGIISLMSSALNDIAFILDQNMDEFIAGNTHVLDLKVERLKELYYR